MSYLSRFSPVRAYRDLRAFLAGRRPHELLFLALAMSITLTVIWAFLRDSRIERDYRPDIIYVEQYTLDRSDAQIAAQQKIDAVAKAKRLAEVRKIEEERRASFKRLDEKLESYGL